MLGADEVVAIIGEATPGMSVAAIDTELWRIMRFAG